MQIQSAVRRTESSYWRELAARVKDVGRGAHVEMLSEPLQRRRSAGANLLCDPGLSRIALRQRRQSARLEAFPRHAVSDHPQRSRLTMFAYVATVIVLPFGTALAQEFIGMVNQPVTECCRP